LKGISREAKEKKGDLRIANMAEQIERIFNLLGLSRKISIYDTVDEGLASFAELAPKQKP
jgi:anti-anti-sigma regulatory factor